MVSLSKFKLDFASWYARLAAFKVEDLFSRHRPPGPPRTLYINESLPQAYFDVKGKVKREHVYTSNQVITSKYNIITFLPRNLLEQFRRIANMYVVPSPTDDFIMMNSQVFPGYRYPPILSQVRNNLAWGSDITPPGYSPLHCLERWLRRLHAPPVR